MADPGWSELRRQYGGVYITVFPDGRTVPWKPLSMGEYIYYDQQITRFVIPPACLEDEVFQKCVLDHSILDNMDSLPAGVVTTVVHNIWEYSGPNTPDKLQQDLDIARSIVKEGRAAVLHQCAYMIATGFNYTLEEVYNLNYETFMLRLAQAESKMLTMNMIRDPLSITAPQAEKPKFAPLNQNRTQLDAKALWEQQRRPRTSQSTVAPPVSTKEKGKWWNISPVLEAERRRSINFTAEGEATDDLVLDSHERSEKGAMKRHIIESKLKAPRAKMVDDARMIYKDLIAELEKSKKSKK